MSERAELPATPELPGLPAEVVLEVKTSRSGTIPISARDLEGVGPSGYLVALLNDRMLHGPRPILARARGLRARGYDEAALAEVAEPSLLAEALNRGWSDWILDREAWSRLFSAGSTGVAERVAWCRVEHPPRSSAATGAVPEMKLATALAEFRARLDEVASGGTGSQIEGQVHQALLGDVLGQMGYEVTLNPVGVPDIVAKVRGAGLAVGPGLGSDDVLARVRAWQPTSEPLRDVQERLLELGVEEVREVVRVMRGN